MKDLDDALRDLARDIPPARELWPGIAAQLVTEPGPAKPEVRFPARFRRVTVAASLAALVGMSLWLARSPEAPDSDVTSAVASRPAALQMLGADYLRDRERLLASFPGQLAALPPESQAKVAASLADIHRALHDIDAALTQDSGSPLLQELLINTCQDEMRVLMAVQEAGAAGRTV